MTFDENQNKNQNQFNWFLHLNFFQFASKLCEISRKFNNSPIIFCQSFNHSAKYAPHQISLAAPWLQKKVLNIKIPLLLNSHWINKYFCFRFRSFCIIILFKLRMSTLHAPNWNCFNLQWFNVDQLKLSQWLNSVMHLIHKWFEMKITNCSKAWVYIIYLAGNAEESSVFINKFEWYERD